MPTPAAAPRTAFTMNTIERIAPPESGRIPLRDPKTPGLLVYVMPTGARSWYVYKKVNGTPRKIRLGDFPTLTIDDARRLAAEHLGSIARGIDPSIERKRIRQETTLGELWSIYLEQHAKPRKRTWKQDERRYEKHLKKWATRRLSGIDSAEVQTLHAKIGQDGIYEANHVVKLLSGIYSFAKSRNWKGEKPTGAIKRFRTQTRKRRLSPDEHRRLWNVVTNYEDRDARHFVTLAILTGIRASNVREMRWDWIDFDRGLVTVPQEEYKNGEEQTFPLHPLALSILEERRRDAAEDAVFVFTGRSQAIDVESDEKPRAGFRRHWDRMRKRAELPRWGDDERNGVKFHDLRRTFASFAADEGVSGWTIGTMLGDRDPKMVEVYARLSPTVLREAISRTVAGLLAAAGAKSEPVIDAEPVESKPDTKPKSRRSKPMELTAAS